MWVLVLWIALYFLITYAPFFVLGPYIAKHSMGGAGTWGIVVTGEGIGALLGGLLGLRLRANGRSSRWGCSSCRRLSRACCSRSTRRWGCWRLPQRWPVLPSRAAPWSGTPWCNG